MLKLHVKYPIVGENIDLSEYAKKSDVDAINASLDNKAEKKDVEELSLQLDSVDNEVVRLSVSAVSFLVASAPDVKSLQYVSKSPLISITFLPNSSAYTPISPTASL